MKCFVDHCLCLCPSVLSGDLVAQSLLFYEVFCRSLFVPLSFVFVVILLLSLYLSVKCFVDHCLCLCPSVLIGDLVAQSLLLCEVFCRSLFVPLSFHFLVGILLLNIYVCVKCFVDHCLCLCPSVFSGDIVAQSLLFCELLCRSLFVPLSFRS